MSRASTPPHPPLCQISLYRRRIITADADDAMVINMEINIQKYFDDCNINLTTVIPHAWTPCKHVKQKAKQVIVTVESENYFSNNSSIGNLYRWFFSVPHTCIKKNSADFTQFQSPFKTKKIFLKKPRNPPPPLQFYSSSHVLYRVYSAVLKIFLQERKWYVIRSLSLPKSDWHFYLGTSLSWLSGAYFLHPLGW